MTSAVAASTIVSCIVVSAVIASAIVIISTVVVISTIVIIRCDRRPDLGLGSDYGSGSAFSPLTRTFTSALAIALFVSVT